MKTFWKCVYEISHLKFLKLFTKLLFYYGDIVQNFAYRKILRNENKKFVK
jgi:hypothetical protein